mmetsp:Transcript_11238/g.31154  ORF Transcript_11238/g.31154 Transcript_11238/m.31154 type:complete len:215 (+) Transcript_11238:1134-1778(+)
MRTASHQAIEQTPGLLHEGVARSLENDTTHVDVNHRLRCHIVLCDPLAITLSSRKFHPKLLTLQSIPTTALLQLGLQTVSLILKSEPCVLTFLTDLASRCGHLRLGLATIALDPLVLLLLLRHKLLPYTRFLLFKGLALTFEFNITFLDLGLSSLNPCGEGPSNVSDHSVKLALRTESDAGFQVVRREIQTRGRRSWPIGRRHRRPAETLVHGP